LWRARWGVSLTPPTACLPRHAGAPNPTHPVNFRQIRLTPPPCFFRHTPKWVFILNANFKASKLATNFFKCVLLLLGVKTWSGERTWAKMTLSGSPTSHIHLHRQNVLNHPKWKRMSKNVCITEPNLFAFKFPKVAWSLFKRGRGGSRQDADRGWWWRWWNVGH
jgi:hypothetical protein